MYDFGHEIRFFTYELSERYEDHAHGNKMNPLRELLFIICSVQTNESLYQSTYTKLMSAFPKFGQLADASEEQIAATIAHGGLSRQKARPSHPMQDPAAAAAFKKSPADPAKNSAYA